jgi:Zn-dependent peptidase ImmA (M78 family)
MAVTDPFLDQDQLQQYLPPEDFDPFEAVKASVDTQTQQYDYSNIEDVYGTLGLGDYSAAFVGGLVDAVAATGEGAASIYGAVSGDHRLAKQVARYRDSMDDFLTGNVPDELKQKFMYKAVNAVGAMPAYVAMAAGTGGTGLAARGATALAARGLSYSALGANAFQQGRDDYISSIGAEGRDLTDDEAREANKIGAMTGIPLMVLERVGATTLVNSLFRGTGGSATAGDIVKRLAKAPLAEAGTEGTQTLLQNFIASEVASYDPDRPINAGVIESMILGGIASGAYSVPAVGLQIQSERLAENIDNGNINAQELIDDLGQKLMGAAIDANAIPATGADESKILHTRGNVQKFVDNVLTPLTTTLSKAGPQYKRAFRDFERQTGVQIGKSKQIIDPFIKKMNDLKKISNEDYDTLQDALANVGIINKDNQEVLDALDSQEATAEVSTPELKDNDVFEVDPNMPSDTTASETYVINGAKTERKTRGLTPDETQGGIQAQEVTAKINGINQQVKNAKQALSDVLPDLKVNVYASQKEFQDATGVDGDSNAGFYKDGQVYINASLARSNTVAHEVFHAAFLAEAPTSKEAQNASLELMNAIERSSKNERLVQYARRFSAQYDPAVQNEESLAEMFGVLSANYATLDVSTKTTIKAWVAKVADMLGVSGLFSEATTDKDMIDAFNALSSSVANGTVTPEGIRITRGSGTIGSNGTEAQQRFQADYTDPNTGVTYSYFKNTEDYQEMVDKKFITNDTSFFDFDGRPMHLHTPDGMFTGKIEHKGVTLAEGRGGLNFPAFFHNDMAFWASTEDAANSMADHLNSQLRDPNTDGKVRMMLVSSNIDKAFSSVDGTAYTTRILSRISELVPPEHKAEAEKLFLDSIKKAAKQTVTKKVKETDKKTKKVTYKDKIFGLKSGNVLDKAETADQAAMLLDDFVNDEKRSFNDRKTFVELLIKDMTSKLGYSAKHLQGKDNPPKNLDFRVAYQKIAQEMLLNSSKMSEQSDFFKLAKKDVTPSTNQPNAYFLRGLAYMINEPMIRDQDASRKELGSVPNGSAYAVIEMKGRVKAVELLKSNGSQKHRSYRYAIVSESNEKATIHLLRDRVKAVDHYDRGVYEPDHENAGEPVTAESFLPTSGWSGLRYGTKMINKEKAKRFDPKKLMEPMTGRGAKLKFPEKRERFQKRPDETHEQALNRMLEKHNMKNEFQSVRKLLNYLYTSGREAGMDVSYMEQYFPRLVTDLAGLQDSWKGQIYDSEIERELDIYAKKKFNGRDLDPLERQVFLENLARNKILRGRTGSIQPAGTKERTIPIIDPDRRKSYYAPAEQALDTYVSSMISSINQMKLIGTARVENGQRVKAGIIGQMMDADLQRGTLSQEAVNIIQDAVDARFGMNGQQSGFIRGAKNAGYIATMGNIGSAITQLGDFYFSAVQNGLVNTVQSALTSKELSREDILGVKNLITIEAADGAKALQKSVDFVFKYSGISALDGFAKDTNINAALRDMRKKVRGKPNSREYQKLMKELSVYQGRQSAQTIADLRNNVNSDLVLEALYNRLANVAPISISEMPAAYARNPNGRIVYSLKSYTIKQFDFIRQESFSKMGSKKTFAEGFTNLLRIATLAMAANGSADVLKAILFNREIDEEDLVWNNILRMFGITKYTTTKARKEGIGTALVNTILPPQIGILNDFTKDIDTSIKNGQFDIDEMRSVKYLPFVGKLYYWREGKGKEVEKRLANLKD